MRPRRALPWEDVQRLLRAVDTSSARGLRDYVLLLLMSTYGREPHCLNNEPGL